jgi:phosphopantetheine adenylyltransferase
VEEKEVVVVQVVEGEEARFFSSFVEEKVELQGERKEDVEEERVEEGVEEKEVVVVQVVEGEEARFFSSFSICTHVRISNSTIV